MCLVSSFVELVKGADVRSEVTKVKNGKKKEINEQSLSVSVHSANRTMGN